MCQKRDVMREHSYSNTPPLWWLCEGATDLPSVLGSFEEKRVDEGDGVGLDLLV